MQGWKPCGRAARDPGLSAGGPPSPQVGHEPVRHRLDGRRLRAAKTEWAAEAGSKPTSLILTEVEQETDPDGLLSTARGVTGLRACGLEQANGEEHHRCTPLASNSRGTAGRNQERKPCDPAGPKPGWCTQYGPRR